MHASYLALHALDLAEERTRDAERRARLLAGAGPAVEEPGRTRRELARLAALASVASAGLARRLDPQSARSILGGHAG